MNQDKKIIIKINLKEDQETSKEPNNTVVLIEGIIEDSLEEIIEVIKEIIEVKEVVTGALEEITEAIKVIISIKEAIEITRIEKTGRKIKID